MADTYWLKQTDKPLFPDLLWSRPENKRLAGKLLIVGGNLHGFAAPGAAFSTALKAGIGTARVLLPDSLEKTLKKMNTPQPSPLDAVPGHSTLRDEPSGSDSKRSQEERVKRTPMYVERVTDAADAAMRQEPAGTAGFAGRQGKVVGELWAEFAPSTPSGSFSKMALAQLLEAAEWADGVLLAGDFGRNSETTILLESFLSKYSGAVILPEGTIEVIEDSVSLLRRPNTLIVAKFSKLQKLGQAYGLKEPIKNSMDLLQFVRLLHDWTSEAEALILTIHGKNIVLACRGQVSTTAFAQTGDVSPALSAYASAWWLQQPSKPFESITSSAWCYQQDSNS